MLESTFNPASDDGRYFFVHSCPDSTLEDIRDLKESEKRIKRQTFVRKLGPGEWGLIQQTLGYDRWFPISGADWQIPYYKGVYRGVPAVFLEWSAMEFIFTLNGDLGPSAAKKRNPNRTALVLVQAKDGLGVLMIDPDALRRVVADGSFWNKTCPAGLGFAVTNDGQVKRQIARDGWLKALLHGATSVITGDLLAVKDEIQAGEAAVESAAAELGVSAEEVAGVLLDDAEAWAEWATVAVANPRRNSDQELRELERALEIDDEASILRLAQAYVRAGRIEDPSALVFFFMNSMGRMHAPAAQLKNAMSLLNAEREALRRDWVLAWDREEDWEIERMIREIRQDTPDFEPEWVGVFRAMLIGPDLAAEYSVGMFPDPNEVDSRAIRAELAARALQERSRES